MTKYKCTKLGLLILLLFLQGKTKESITTFRPELTKKKKNQRNKRRKRTNIYSELIKRKKILDSLLSLFHLIIILKNALTLGYTMDSVDNHH